MPPPEILAGQAFESMIGSLLPPLFQ